VPDTEATDDEGRQDDSERRPHAKLIALMTMVRGSEFPAAWSGLATIRRNIDENTRHFVLLNDPPNPTLEADLAKFAQTSLVTPGKNLGVAAGRNALIRAAIDWGAHYLISLDDDLLVPDDFVARTVRHLDELENAGLSPGIVGPAVLDFHAVAKGTMTPEETLTARLGTLSSFGSTSEQKLKIGDAWAEIPPDLTYHLGIRDWRRHYVAVRGGAADRARGLVADSIQDAQIGFDPSEPTELRHDAPARQTILEDSADPIEVDAVPGGACAYSRQLINQIGLMDETFSPFGYEDSDFSVRAKTAGYRNYFLPSELVLHDLDSRGKSRSIASLLFLQGRSRALIARRHLDLRNFHNALVEGALLGPLFVQTMASQVDKVENAQLATYVAGLTGWLGGWIRGCFIEDARTIGDYPDPPPSLTIPKLASIEQGIELSIWPLATPRSGLPSVVRAQLRIEYRFDPALATFDLYRLDLDAAGLGRVQISARLSRVGLENDLEPGSSRLDHLELRLRDEGFIRRLNTTVAWHRGERTPGYFGAFAAGLKGAPYAGVRRFLSGSPVGQTLDLLIRPETPLTMDELTSLTTNRRRAAERLGLKIEAGSR